MYMKNTVSKEMKLRQQPTHIHMPTQKRSTRTPNQQLHQSTTSHEAQSPQLQQQHYHTLHGQSSRLNTLGSGSDSGINIHKSSRATARAIAQASGAGGGDATERVHGGGITQKPINSRGFSATVGVKGTTAGAGQQHSQSMHSLLMARVAGDSGSVPQQPNNNNLSSVLHIQQQNSSLLVSRQDSIHKKQYQTSYSRSDKKNGQSFTDEGLSPETPQSLNLRQQNIKLGNSTEIFNASLALFPSDTQKQSAQSCYFNDDGAAMKRTGNSSIEQTPTSEYTAMMRRRITPESDGKAGENLYDQRRQVTVVKSNRPSDSKGRSPSNNTGGKQELKMEDLIQTPKRYDEPAFQQSKLFCSQQRTQTQSRLNGVSRTSSAECDSLPRYPAQHQSRVQTEEGDGAQAQIETDSDERREYEQINLDHPAMMQRKLVEMFNQQTVMSQAQRAVAIGYQQENSSFGPQILNGVIGQVAADESASFDHRLDNVDVGCLSDQEGEEDEEVVVKAYRIATEDTSIKIQDKRRNRAERPSAKNLFCKSQGLSSANESSSILEEQQLHQLAVGDAIATAPRMHHIQMPAQQSKNMGGPLQNSRSQMNFQYLLGEEEQLQHHQQDTDEEIFDQDGGQDGTASNFVDVDSCDDSSILSPKANVHPALINFRRHNQIGLSQPGSQMAGWAHHQEPHIDEELSDAEDDNTSENFDDQGLELESLDSEREVALHHYHKTSTTAKASKRHSGARILVTEGESDVFKKQPAVRPDLQTPKRLAYQKSVKTINNASQNLTTSAALNENKRTGGKLGNQKSDGTTARGRFGKVAVTRPSKNGFQTPIDMAFDMITDKNPILPPKSAHATTLKRKQQTYVTRTKLKSANAGQLKPQIMSSIDYSYPTLSPKRSLQNENNSNEQKKSEPFSRGTPRQQPITNFQLQQEQARLMRFKQINQTRMKNTAFGSSSIHQKGGSSNTTQSGQPVFQPAAVISSGYNQPQQNQQSTVVTQKESSAKQIAPSITNYSSSIIQKFESQCKSRQSKVSHANTSLLQKQLTIGGSSSSAKKQQQSVNSEMNTSIFVTTTAVGNQKEADTHSSVLNCKQFIKAASSSQVKPFSMEMAEPATELTNKVSSNGGAVHSAEKRFQSTKSRQNAQFTTAFSASAPFTIPKHHSSINSSVNVSKMGKIPKEKIMKNAAPSSHAVLTGVSSSSTILQSHLRQLQQHQQSMTHLHPVGTTAQQIISAGTQGSTSSKIPLQSTVPPGSIATKSMMSSVKDSNQSGSISHTAARGAGKRGFLKETGGTASSQNQAQAQSVAQLPMLTEESAIIEAKLAKDNRQIGKGKKKLSFKGHTASVTGNNSVSGGASLRTAKRGSTSTTAAYMTIDASKASMKIQESMATLRTLHPPSSSKNSEILQQVKFDEVPPQASSSKIFQSTRQRTNTTLGLQSNKHSSMRQSMNNLTLQDLMASSQPSTTLITSTIQHKSAGMKQQSTRGNTAGKSLMSGTLSVNYQSGLTGSFKPNTNTSSLVKSAYGGTKKQASATINNEKTMANSQVNERVEQLAGKVGEIKKYTKGVGQTRNQRRPDAMNPSKRSLSTMKSYGTVVDSGVANSSHLSLNTVSEGIGQRKSNAQHSIIMSAADKGTTNRGGADGSKRSSIQASSHTKDWGLSDFEKAQYGDRCPRGYEKISLLGKGGCAIVWLAREMSTGNQVALKQFPKPKNQTGLNTGVLDPTAKIEIEMGKLLFSESSSYNGYSINPKEFPGILKIAKLNSVIEESKDVWLSYQVGGRCLTSLLFDVKGEFYKGERIYGVQHGEFYRALKSDKKVLIDMIRMLAEVFDVLAMFRIVHADIKPDNILIDFDGQRLKDIKLIDFGSAFSYESPSNISATTPEYLAPEVLTYLERRGQNTDINGTNSTNLCRMQEPWSYDMWSLGAILLELLTGIPLWMSMKCRAVTQTGKQLFGMGIFGVQGRLNKKILAKQNQQLKNLASTLKKYDCYGLDKEPMFMDLLLKMLDPNPITRISPIEVLEHPYIKNNS